MTSSLGQQLNKTEQAITCGSSSSIRICQGCQVLVAEKSQTLFLRMDQFWILLYINFYRLKKSQLLNKFLKMSRPTDWNIGQIWGGGLPRKGQTWQPWCSGVFVRTATLCPTCDVVERKQNLPYFKTAKLFRKHRCAAPVGQTMGIVVTSCAEDGPTCLHNYKPTGIL